MSKKVLFLYPTTSNRASITLAIPIVAGIAKRHGWELFYFDTAIYEKGQDSFEDKEMTGGFLATLKYKAKKRDTNQLIPDLQSAIEGICPDILCISAMSCEFEYLMSFFPAIKIPANTLVVIGGVHCILKPEEVLDNDLFDVVCTGQGELVFEDILTRKETNQAPNNIEGTYFRDRLSGIKTKNNRRSLLPPNELWKIDADYSFYNDEYFLRPFDNRIVRIFGMEVGRGCPWRCTYCGNTAIKSAYNGLGKYVCSRPIELTFKNFRFAVEELKIDIFNFTAECFLAQPSKWLREFAERYAREVRKPFLIQTRSETVNVEKLQILKDCHASFFQVGMGVESGSPRILNEICDRHSDVGDIIRAYDLLNAHGIRSSAYFMIGFPTETREDIFQTIDLCRRINAHINSVSIFQPLPGTALADLCIRQGYITGKEPLETFTSGSILKMPQISSEEITNLRRVFLLYAKLPKEYYGDIEKCEHDYENNRELFDKLVKLRWDYDQRWRVFNNNF